MTHQQNGDEEITSTTRRLEVLSIYGKSFGITDGTGCHVDELGVSMVETFSPVFYRAVEAVAIQQMWMDLMGNTILAFVRGTLTGSPRKEQNRIFEIVFFFYYIMLYFFLLMESRILETLPSNQPLLYKTITWINGAVSSIFIVPVGFAGLVMLPFYIFHGGEAQPLPSRGSYVPVPEDSSTSGITYAIDLVKPTQDSQVGMRLGFNSKGQIIITSIKPNSIASSCDLRAGDAILSVNGKNLRNNSPEEVTQFLRNSTGVLTITVAHMAGIFP
jgi:hypothetical protein